MNDDVKDTPMTIDSSTSSTAVFSLWMHGALPDHAALASLQRDLARLDGSLTKLTAQRQAVAAQIAAITTLGTQPARASQSASE